MDADVDMHDPEHEGPPPPGMGAPSASDADSPDLYATDLMRSLSVVLNTKLRVVVCHCGHFVDVVRLTSHFANHASEGRSDTGARLALLVKELRAMGVPDGLPDLSPSIVHREPIAGVPVFSVYGCSACVYHCAERRKVDKHCRKLCTAGSEAHVLDLRVQRPMQNMGYIRLIQPPPNPAVAPLVSAMVQFQADQVQKLRKEEQNLRLVSPLLVRTGWHQQVAGHDIAALLAASTYPDKDEYPGLAQLVLEYFQRATDLLPCTDRLVLQKLNTPEPARTGINHEPLHRLQEHDSSLAAYVRPVVNIMAILLRQATGAYPIPSSVALTAAVDALRSKLRDGARIRLKHLHEVLYALWFTEWGRDAPAQTVVDPTLASLTLLALKPDGSFVDAQGLTGILAKLTRAIQLAALYEIHGQMSVTGKQTVGFQLKQAQHLERFVQEAQLTTFASVRSLQHYATSISYSSINVPRIWWTDTKTWHSLLYRGRKFTLDHLRRIVARIQADVISSFESLAAGVDTDLCYDDLMDDPRSRDNGYTAADPLRPALRERFEQVSSRIIAAHGLLDKDTGKLDSLACRKFLSRLAALDRALMLAVHMGSGGPPRGTELTCMMLRNTAERLRNLYMFGTRPCILRSYNKTTSNHQRDKVIPNSLDAVTGDVIFRKALFFNPIAAYIAPHVWPERAAEVSQLYYNMLFVDFGHLFTTEDISKAMTALSVPICGWALIVSAYRHIYVAFARKLLHQRDEDGEDAEEVDANQAGHTGTMGRAHYGLSHQTFVGADEDTMRAFTDNSDMHCKNVHLCPGGQGLPYYEVTTTRFLQSQQEASAAAAAAAPPTLASVAELMSSGFATLGAQVVDLRSDLQATAAHVHRLEAQLAAAPPPAQPHQQAPIIQAAPPQLPSSSFPYVPSPHVLSPHAAATSDQASFPSPAHAVAHAPVQPPSPAIYTYRPKASAAAKSPAPPSFPATPSRQSHSAASGTSLSPLSTPPHDEQDVFASHASRTDDGLFSLPEVPFSPSWHSTGIDGSPSADRPLRPLNWKNPPRLRARSDVSMESISSVPPSPAPPPSSSIHPFDSEPSSQSPPPVYAPRQSTQSSSVHPFDRPPSPVVELSASSGVGLPRSTALSPYKPVLFLPVPPTLECMFDQPYPRSPSISPNDMIHWVRMLLVCVTAVWTCVEQRAAVIALLRLDRDVFISLRTAAGKSLIAILSSYVETGITVILIPLRALFADWKRRLEAMHVPFEAFETGGKSALTGLVRIVLVSVDVAEQHHWRLAVQSLQSKGAVITRIIVDEIHLVLSQNFRACLKKVHELRFAPCPLVLMSATIPPSSVPWFTERFAVQNPLMIRGLSIRREIAYDVRPHFEKFADLVRPIKDLYKLLTEPEDRYMIFVSSIDAGQELAALLGIELFHGLSEAKGRKMTAKMQTDIYKRWTSGQNRGIVTTNALSAGNDYSHVRFVLHAFTPYNAIDYIQESGRAGRDGRYALAAIFPFRTMPDSRQPQDIKDISGSDVIRRIVYDTPGMDVRSPERCIRYALGLFNDGVGKTCLQVRDCQRCMFCVQCEKDMDLSERSRNERYAIDEMNPPPLQPLVPSDYMPDVRSQAELQELLVSRFGAAQEASEAITLERLGTQADELARYAALLKMTEDTCGYCFVCQLLSDARGKRVSDLHHNPNHCPNLTEPEKKAFFLVRKNVHYDRSKTPGPCYTCHFPAMGSDTLHPPYTGSDTPHAHRNLILPMLWAIRHVSRDLYSEAMARFDLGGERGHHWDDAKGMAAWVSDPDATQFPVSGMALMDFVCDRFDLARE
ncbi:hypothetical protein BD626DRAFT_576164 [Schizophyllum amplum]|uniref:DNA 3'-5' helicase n=1 Tax=Schizophyllum amplum TaxID=97359 RepID=A0A550BU09_9AGAR|nr:hypothetical protein BD626DRAFT_576164 [Auriculariopsis ampla]